jgi:hypothetical protein
MLNMNYQKGLNDIREKIIRTPKPPLMTFIDDPLRVLRSIRFASRFDFCIDHDLFLATQNQKVIVCVFFFFYIFKILIQLIKIRNTLTCMV